MDFFYTVNSAHLPSASTNRCPTVPLRGSVALPSPQTLCATPECQQINNQGLGVLYLPVLLTELGQFLCCCSG